MVSSSGMEKRPAGDIEDVVGADPVVQDEGPQTQLQQDGQGIQDPDAINQLQEMFPALDKESITEFYSM